MNYAVLNFRHEDEQDPHRCIVAEALQQANAQNVKVFRTFVPALESDQNEHDFIFLTTHKETHLGFGMFEKMDALRSLCYLLGSMFRGGEFPLHQVLLYKDAEKKEGWLITKTQVDMNITYTWTPAH